MNWEKSIASFLKKETEILTLYAITFEQIKIQKRSTPQNECLNLSFVKNIYVVGKKMTRNGRKIDIFET